MNFIDGPCTSVIASQTSSMWCLKVVQVCSMRGFLNHLIMSDSKSEHFSILDSPNSRICLDVYGLSAASASLDNSSISCQTMIGGSSMS